MGVVKVEYLSNMFDFSKGKERGYFSRKKYVFLMDFIFTCILLKVFLVLERNKIVLIYEFFKMKEEIL